MKIFEMFSGYGTATFALKKLGIDHELIGYSDIDKYANQCFQQNHGGKELGDCTKIDPQDLPDFDLLTGGFPCQAFSVAGKGLGELDTRGTLFNDIIRIAEVKQPRYMLLENVKGLTTKRHKETFEKILSELDRIGYYVKWKILNTKDYGIPQNRERVWIVCFLDFLDYNHFDFPKKEELKIFLKDILEDEVDEKYYLKQEQVDRLIATGFKDKDVQNTIRSGGRGSLDGKHTWDAVKVGNINPSGKGMNGNVYGGNVSPTITINKGEGSKIIYKKLGKIYSNGDCAPANRLYNKESICPTIINSTRTLVEDFRIRKLTPTECFRLQGFLEDEIDLEGLSNTQKYKLAGNGQSVNVVRKIFDKMFNCRHGRKVDAFKKDLYVVKVGNNKDGC